VERIKRQKSQARRGDDVGPQVQPESLVPVSQFRGSRLASAPTASPFQQSGSTSVKKGNKEVHERPSKVSRSSLGATVAAAIVEAENSLEIDVCFPISGEAFFRTNI
jgi:5'-3' exoribonuclease 2